MNNKTSKSSLSYRSGDAFLPESIRKFLATYIVGNDNTVFYINYWSLFHMTTGIVFGIVLRNVRDPIRFYLACLLVHTIWEAWQIHIGMTRFETTRGKIDTINDTIFFLMGASLSKFATDMRSDSSVYRS